MKLLYSKDRCLFWIAEYCKCDSTQNVEQHILELRNLSETFAKFVKCSPFDVQTLFIYSSDRFAKMRVFFVETDKIPISAAYLGSLTMNEYLRHS